jgi:CheY-like chemotaxis protein
LRGGRSCARHGDAFPGSRGRNPCVRKYSPCSAVPRVRIRPATPGDPLERCNISGAAGPCVKDCNAGPYGVSHRRGRGLNRGRGKGIRMKIAIADDDDAITDYIRGILEGGGHHCTVFRNGTALVTQLQRDTFDLIVLDWSMPGMTGIEILGWIQQSLAVPPAVIMLTSRSGKDDIANALAAGADDYIVKPEASNVIAARVGAVLRRAMPTAPAIGAARAGIRRLQLRPDDRDRRLQRRGSGADRQGVSHWPCCSSRTCTARCRGPISSRPFGIASPTCRPARWTCTCPASGPNCSSSPSMAIACSRSQLRLSSRERGRGGMMRLAILMRCRWRLQHLPPPLPRPPRSSVRSRWSATS